MKHYLCPYLLLLTCPLIASNMGTWTSDRQDLTRYVLDPDFYDKRVRPSGDDSPTTLVDVTLYPLVINDINAVAETMETTAWLRIRWADDRLTWTEESDDSINVPQDEVWRPDISLKNSNTDPQPLGNKYMQVDIESDGTVYWFPFQVFNSYCDLDTTHFPFDIQTCELQFSAWSYVESKVTLEEPSINMDTFQPSSQFDVINFTSHEETITETSVAVFTFVLRRKPQFIVMTTVVPIVTLALLSICVFILPVESGEKISYSVTVFLAFMVTLTYVSTILPENSDSISYLAIYVTSQVAQSTLQTFVTIILLRCHNFDEKEKTIPKALVFLVRTFCCLKKAKSNNKPHSSKQPYEKPRNEYDGRISKRETHGSNTLSKQYSGGSSYKSDLTHGHSSVAIVYTGKRNGRYDVIEDIPERDYPVESYEEELDTNTGAAFHDREQVTWKTVVGGLDLFFFCFFLLSTTACTILFIVAAAYRV